MQADRTEYGPLQEIRLTGLPVSEGVSHAPAALVDTPRHELIPYYRLTEEQVPGERERLRKALEKAEAELEGLVATVTERIGAAQANIFLAQKMMVADPVLREQMLEVIAAERVNAEVALEKTLDQYESQLLEVDNEYLKDRASDIGEIRRRIRDVLRCEGFEGRPQETVQPVEAEGRHILVATELTPSQTATLDTSRTVGFITERGGQASHAAILARSLGIPAVSGLKNLHGLFGRGEHVLVDGTTGDVIINPSDATLQLYPAARRRGTPSVQKVARVEGAVVMANISLAAEVDVVRAVDAEGIGLYRTEFECLALGRLLSEEEQYARYRAVVEAMEGKPLYVRLLDLGGDKSNAFLDIPAEENPCLGYRGARLLLGHSEVLIGQARALVRAAAHGPIHVIYPMIVDLDQFLVLREVFRQNTRDLPEADIHHGVMFEVPSACLDAHDILEVAEFGSIGTNDLIQYLFAVDRNNDLVAGDYGPDRPVFWSVLKRLAEAAADRRRPLSICGEIGGQPQYLPRLLELGVRTVSVNPRMVGLARIAAKRHLRRQAPGGTPASRRLAHSSL